MYLHYTTNLYLHNKGDVVHSRSGERWVTGGKGRGGCIENLTFYSPRDAYAYTPKKTHNNVYKCLNFNVPRRMCIRVGHFLSFFFSLSYIMCERCVVKGLQQDAERLLHRRWSRHIVNAFFFFNIYAQCNASNMQMRRIRKQKIPTYTPTLAS